MRLFLATFLLLDLRGWAAGIQPIVYRLETTTYVKAAQAEPHYHINFARAASSSSAAESSQFNTSYFVLVSYAPATTCSDQSWGYMSIIPLTTTGPPRSDIFPLTSGTTSDQANSTFVSVLLAPVQVESSVYAAAWSAHEPPGVSLCVEPSHTTPSQTTTSGRNPTTTRKTLTPTATPKPKATATPEGIKCGEGNPTCEKCTLWIEYCYGSCPPITDEYYECRDGKRYRAGAPPSLSASLGRLGMGVSILWVWIWVFRG